MGRLEDVQRVKELLAEATAKIDPDYFLLPFANVAGEAPIFHYREGVYAYQLYHQLRVLWPTWDYSLGGEVNKRLHLLVCGPDLDNVMPDLLVHKPGCMNHNLVTFEIKAASRDSEPDAIEKDIRKLIAFRGRARYEVGILLVYGEQIGRVQEHAERSKVKGLNIDLIELWHHPNPHQPARKIQWVRGVT
jgi:hypothetical protein